MRYCRASSSSGKSVVACVKLADKTRSQRRLTGEPCERQREATCGRVVLASSLQFAVILALLFIASRYALLCSYYSTGRSATIGARTVLVVIARLPGQLRPTTVRLSAGDGGGRCNRAVHTGVRISLTSSQ